MFNGFLPAPSGNPKDWSCDDVCNWLCSIGFENYAKFFGGNRIDGAALLLLTNEDLFLMVKSFHEVFKLGDMIKFRNDLAQLQKQKRSIPDSNGHRAGVASASISVVKSDRYIPPNFVSGRRGSSPLVSIAPSDGVPLGEVLGHKSLTELGTNGRNDFDAEAEAETRNVKEPRAVEEEQNWQHSNESDDIIILDEEHTTASGCNTIVHAPETDQEQHLETDAMSTQTVPTTATGTAGTMSKEDSGIMPTDDSSSYAGPKPSPPLARESPDQKSQTQPPSQGSIAGQNARTPKPSAHLSRLYYLHQYPSYSMQLPNPGQLTRGYISFAESPMEFNIQFESSYDKVKKLGHALNNFYNHDPYVLPLAPELIKPNTACAAKFEGDWYRAIITKVDMDNVWVRYVDYGNSEKLNRRDLMSLKKDRYTDVPPYSVLCRLAGIPRDFKIPEAMKDDFYDLVEPMNKCFLFKFESFTQLPPYPVELMDPVNNRLVNLSFQQKLGIEPESSRNEIPSLPAVAVSAVSYPYDDYYADCYDDDDDD